MRRFVLGAALALILVMGALTVNDLIHYGLTPLNLLAWMVLALFLIGIIGALREPPKD